MNFGVIVKRKTLLKSFAFVLAVLALVLIIKRRSESDLFLDSLIPDEHLTWSRFTNECGGGETQHKSIYNYNNIYKDKVIKWSGIVIRVDSYDDDNFDDSQDVWID